MKEFMFMLLLIGPTLVFGGICAFEAHNIHQSLPITLLAAIAGTILGFIYTALLLTVLKETIDV